MKLISYSSSIKMVCRKLSYTFFGKLSSCEPKPQDSLMKVLHLYERYIRQMHCVGKVPNIGLEPKCSWGS